jgi:hypothetical protein
MQMLDIVKMFPQTQPDGSRASESHAVSWLLQNSSLLKQLSLLVMFAGGSSVPDTAADVHVYCAPPMPSATASQWVVSPCSLLLCRLFAAI